MIDPIILRDLPGIADIERVKSTRGAEWLPENDDLQDRIDRISIALFGITEADTREPEPTMDSVWLDGLITEREKYSLKHEQILQDEWNVWSEEEDFLNYLDCPADEPSALVLCGSVVLDVSGENGLPLRCLPSFARQIVAAANEYIEGAKLTLDGSGSADDTAEAEAEKWGAGIVADAAKFKPSRK